VCGMLCRLCRVWFVMSRHVSYVSRHVSCVACHVMLHVWCESCHVFDVTCLFMCLMCHAKCVSLVMGVTSSVSVIGVTSCFTCGMSCHDSCVLCHVRGCGVCDVVSVMSHVSCHMRHVCVSCHVCQTKTGGADCKCAYAYNHALVEACHVFDVTCLFMSLMSAWCRLVSVHFVYVEAWLLGLYLARVPCFWLSLLPSISLSC